MLERPITFKVRLPSERERSRQPQLSLLRRTFQPAADARPTRASHESRLGAETVRRGVALVAIVVNLDVESAPTREDVEVSVAALEADVLVGPCDLSPSTGERPAVKVH